MCRQSILIFEQSRAVAVARIPLAILVIFTNRDWNKTKYLVLIITIIIIIQSKFFFLFIGREPTTWPANNCLQIMVACVWLQIIFCTCVKETVLFSFLRSLLRENGRSVHYRKWFPTTNDPGTANDPQSRPQMIPKEKEKEKERPILIICGTVQIASLPEDIHQKKNSVTEW